MLRIVSSGAAVLIWAAAFACAGDQSDPDQSCDGSTYEMVECLRAKTAQWDKRMTIAYQRMLNAGESKRASSCSWRSACGSNTAVEGTIARIEAGDCMRDAEPCNRAGR